MNLEIRLRELLNRIRAAEGSADREPGSVTLLAVSKTRPASDIAAAFACGQRDGLGASVVVVVPPCESDLIRLLWLQSRGFEDHQLVVEENAAETGVGRSQRVGVVGAGLQERDRSLAVPRPKSALSLGERATSGTGSFKIVRHPSRKTDNVDNVEHLD